MAAPRTVVVVGASAGGVEALTDFAGALPADLRAGVAVVLHVSPGGSSVLGGILDRAGPLPAATAIDGEELEEGHVYVAKPDFHLLLEDGVASLDPGPRENGHRPAVDALFRSAALSYGPRAIAVVLSGSRDDGTAGAAVVRAAGGRIAVQDPDDALYPSMPLSVLEHVGADASAGLRELAGIVAGWCAAEVETAPDAAVAGDGGRDPHAAGDPGSTGLTCPECGGAIYLDAPAGVARLACHTGHTFSPATFADEQEQALEAALWAVVRRLEERAALLRRLAGQIEIPTGGMHTETTTRADEAQAQAQAIRDLIVRRVAEPA